MTDNKKSFFQVHILRNIFLYSIQNIELECLLNFCLSIKILNFFLIKGSVNVFSIVKLWMLIILLIGEIT